MKIVIAGGRDFDNYNLLREKCDEIIDSNLTEIISGCAKGADTLGERYAKERGFNTKLFPADWKTHGRKAGPIRNKQMADYGEMLIAFWDGKSSGTKNMIENSKKLGLIVHIINYQIFINMINEEINKIKYMFGYQPGVVISEQATPPPAPAPSPAPAPTTSPSTGDTTTKKITEKDVEKMRDCSNFKSGGKLTKGEEIGDFVIFNGPDSKPACKKPKEEK